MSSKFLLWITVELFERLKEGREDSNELECSGRPRLAVNEKIVEIVREFLKKEPKSSFQEAKQAMLCFILVFWSVCWNVFVVFNQNIMRKDVGACCTISSLAHRSTLITDFFTTNGFWIINHSPYSPNFAPWKNVPFTLSGNMYTCDGFIFMTEIRRNACSRENIMKDGYSSWRDVVKEAEEAGVCAHRSIRRLPTRGSLTHSLFTLLPCFSILSLSCLCHPPI